MSDKVYTYNEYVLSYDIGEENDRSCMIISKILNGNLYVMAELYDGSADIVSIMLDNLQQELQQKENIINELEKYGKQRFNEYEAWKEECKNLCYINGITEMLDKLQELKESETDEQ